MKRLKLILPLLFMCAFFSGVRAQVAIGDSVKAKNFSVLELVSQYKTMTFGGLRLPQLTTTERDNKLMQMQAFIDNKTTLAKGLMIYNITTKKVEYWNGTKWVVFAE